MTDQGRGYGAAPWDPGQPQYDGSPYGGGDPYGAPAQPYAQQPAYPQGWTGGPGDPYGGQYPQPGYPPQPGYAHPGYPQQQPYPGQGYPPQQPYADGSYQHPYAPQPQAQPAQHPDEPDWAAEAAALDAETTEPLEEPYPEHESAEEEPGEPLDTLLGDQDTSRTAERRREKRAKKAGKRNGCACLLVSLVLLGGIGTGGWYGYNLYESRFGPPPDYAGSGTGSVQVTIPDGATGSTMAQTLFDAGVIKSVRAFVNAYNKSTQAASIQPGLYTMQLKMSAESALQLLISAAGGETLIIPEGLRASQIYPLIDKKLGLASGTTAKVAKQDVGQLGLPGYAHGDVEGFLWPTRYSIGKGEKPLDLLKEMVSNAVQQYQAFQTDAGAAGVKLDSGYQVVIEASIVEAEGNNSQDYAKIARVLYNRLNGTATQGRLQLDTTLQYYLGRTTFTNAEKNTLNANGYNTYINKGLPPGPISNPGAAAIKAVLNPTPGDWVYFIAVTPSDTRFDVTFDQFKKDVQDYCSLHHQGFDAEAAQCE